MPIARILLAWVAAAALSADAAPPTVVRTVPAHGAVDVDPTITLLSVTFDQDMDTRGASWVGGGVTFPKTDGKFRWLDKRTCVLPVEAAGDHNYSLSINGGRFMWFRNAAGEPVAPYPLVFATAPAAGQAALTAERNRAAARALREAIDTKYAYRDLRKVDWAARFAAFTPKLLACKGRSGFAMTAADLLAAAKDAHIWLKVGPVVVPAHQRHVRANFNGRVVSRLVPKLKRYGQLGAVGRFPDGVGYILVSSWGRSQATEVEKAVAALGGLRDVKALIVDVRPNQGGDEMLARRFAGCFLAEPRVYAGHRVRDATAVGGFTSVQKRVVTPNTDAPKLRVPVAVLIGPVNMSSCEAFLLMMKQVPDCTLIGQRSYGSSGNPKPADLGNGVTVMLPSWQALRADGTCFEGEGIKPDVEAAATAEDFAAGRDPILAAAVALLRRKVAASDSR